MGIITLPVSKKLKHYDRATVSERVAFVVHNARQKRMKLQESPLHFAYEMQYETNIGFSFGGTIILDTKDEKLDVPVKEIYLADFVITIGSINNDDNFGIAVSKRVSEEVENLLDQKATPPFDKKVETPLDKKVESPLDKKVESPSNENVVPPLDGTR